MARYARRRAYRRRPSTRPRRTYTTRTRRSRRPRARNNVNQLTMRAPLASRLLRVKLPWVKTFDSSVATSGSESYAFQGNGVFPYTAAGQTGANSPAAGDSLPAGEVEYSRLYDKYFINGSSINIEAVLTSPESNTLLRAVLLAVPFVTGTGGTNNDDWQAVKAQLDGYTYEQLLAWPYAKWRMIAANTGGVPRLRFKMFRKTKSMCGIKDLRDNQDYGGHLSDGGIVSSMPINPLNGFMYYLRFFNASSQNVAPYSLTVRMSLYFTMTNREFNPITVL